MRLRQIGIGALITVCLYISGLLVILTPLPIVYVSAMSGRKNGLMAAALSFFMVAALYLGVFLFAPLQAGQLAIPLPGLGLLSHFQAGAVQLFGGGYFLFFVAVALVLGEAVRHHWGLVKGGAGALAAGLLLALILALVLQLSGAANIVSGIRGYLEFIVSEIAKIQESAGVTSAQTAYLADNGPEVAKFVMGVIPSLVFVFALIAVVVNLLFSRRFIRMPHCFSGHAWDAAAFRISDVFIWAVIAAAGAFFSGRYVFHADALEFIGINGIIALASVYFFQGLAVTAFFLRRVRFPLVKIAAYILIVLFFQTVGVLIVGLGLADVWVDFRKRSQKMHNVHAE